MANNVNKKVKKNKDNRMKMKLIVNDTEFVVGAEFQSNILSAIPDTPLYEELFHLLSKSPNGELRSELAWKDNLKDETIRLLLKDKDTSVLDRILNNNAAQGIVSTKQLLNFIDIGNHDIIKTIIQNLSNYEDIDIDAVVDKVLDLNNSKLELALAEGWNVPKKILKRLVKSDDPDISYAAKKSLE
jgi:hypothetical protein